MSTAIVPIESKELEVKVSSVVKAAKAIEITDQGSYEQAALFVKEYVNPLLVELDKTHDKAISTAHEAHKEAIAAKKRHYTPLLEAKTIATEKCGTYEQEQRRIQQENQRKDEEEARKREEDERLEEAAAAQKAGVSEEEVDAILDTPMPTAPVKTAPTFNRVPGVTRLPPISTRVRSMVILIRYIAQHPDDLNLLMPNYPALNARLKSQGSLFNIPGVETGRF